MPDRAIGARFYEPDDAEAALRERSRRSAGRAVAAASVLSRRWTAATATSQLESFSPATGERLGAVPSPPPSEVQAVVDAVAKVQPFWAQLTLGDRARYLERAAQVLIDEADEIRDLIVREQGKPRNEAFSMEVLPTIDALHWIATGGGRDPRRREDPDAAAVPEDEELGVHLRAARRDRGHLARGTTRGASRSARSRWR